MSTLKWEDRVLVDLQEYRTVGEHRIRIYQNRLAIWRLDGARMTWEELQKVKQAVWGDCVAVEIYPLQADVVNLRHTRHLWSSPLLRGAVNSECRHPEFDFMERTK